MTPIQEADLLLMLDSWKAGLSVPELPSATTINDLEEIELSQSGVSKKIALGKITSSKTTDLLYNSTSRFIAGVGYNVGNTLTDYSSRISKSFVNPIIRALANGTSNITLLSRGLNKFDASKISKGSLILETDGRLYGSKNYNATDFIFLKAGNWRISGITHSAMSGSNEYIQIYNKSKVFQSYSAVSVLGPATFVMPYDGFIRTSIHDRDVNTFQIESGTVESAYQAGKEYRLDITMGLKESGAAYTMQYYSTSVDDSIEYINGVYVRIQRVDGGVALAVPLYTFDGELGFSVTGKLLVDTGYEIETITNTQPLIVINYPLSICSRNDNATFEEHKNKIALDLNKTNTDTLINSAACFSPRLLEKSGTVHSGGFLYTGFSSGAMIKGKEVYISRCSSIHSTSNPSLAVIIAYIRNSDGSFTTSVLPLDYSQGDFRDPNITTSRDGKYLIFTSSSYDLTTYKAWLYVFDENLAKVGTQVQMTTGFAWGNTLVTPTGKLLKCIYDPSLNGVKLYRSAGTLLTPGTFSLIATIFPTGGNLYNECTLAYWGLKLVAITRSDNAGGAINTTLNLEGDSGWTGVVDLVDVAHAPATEPYIPKGEPFIACVSSFNAGQDTTNRRPAILASKDLVTWTKSYLTPDINFAGGYASFLRNRFGYGVMYYTEDSSVAETNLWFMDVDINRFANQRTFQYELSVI